MRALRFGTAPRHLALIGASLVALSLTSGAAMAASCSGDPPCIEKLVEVMAGGKRYIDVHFRGACKFDVFTLWVANRSSVRFTDPSKGNRNELCSSRPFRYGPVNVGQRYEIAINGCVRHTIGKDDCTWPPSPALSLVIGADAALRETCADYARKAIAASQEANGKLKCGVSGPRWSSSLEQHADWCKTASPQQRQFETNERVRILGECKAKAGAMPYGPDTCKQGFVWREVTPSDHVCVTPQTRDEVRRDNSQASARREPRGGAYGPDTCRQGFVWREAAAGDHVCVIPATRDKARRDNALAAQRRVRG